MKRKKVILLPLDGSEASLTALFPAKSIAILLDMLVHVLYVSDEMLSQQELIAKLHLEECELIRCVVNNKQGIPQGVIMQESKGAEFIFMSAYGEHGYSTEKVAGSVSTDVIINSEIPVLLIRPDMDLPETDGLWKPVHALIPLDGTPGASLAFAPVMRILSKTNAQLDLLHISRSIKGNHFEPGSLSVPYYEDYLQHEWPSWSKEFLRRFCSVTCAKKPDLYVTTGEDVGNEIVSFAKRNNNDLIAMAWHGKLSPERANTFKRVLAESPCPILLTRIIHKSSHEIHFD